MIITPFTFTMKDGRTALIRSPQPEDAPGTLAYLRQSAAESDFLVRYPEEWDGATPEDEAAFFEQLNASEDGAMLMCVVDGQIAGNCHIACSTRLKTRHRASIGIALLAAYWNQGIGTRLLQELIRIAESRPQISQMELEFVEGNARARALYEKMGFRITGMKPNAIRLRDGSLRHEYQMVREIRRGQDAAEAVIR